MSASSSNSAPAAPAAPPSTPAITSQWGLSPIPAWLFSSALVVSPMLRPSPVLENPHTSGSTLLRARIRPTAYPSNAQVVLFSSFVGLGGFMCYDKDPVNGAAVVGVWSLLYFMSNVKKSMWNLKLYPKALSSFALVNSALYGAKYLGFV